MVFFVFFVWGLIGYDAVSSVECSALGAPTIDTGKSFLESHEL